MKKIGAIFILVLFSIAAFAQQPIVRSEWTTTNSPAAARAGLHVMSSSEVTNALAVYGGTNNVAAGTNVSKTASGTVITISADVSHSEVTAAQAAAQAYALAASNAVALADISNNNSLSNLLRPVIGGASSNYTDGAVSAVGRSTPLLFTNAGNVYSGTLTNGINRGNAFSSPGTANGAEQFGNGSVASGLKSTAFGSASQASDGTGPTAFGNSSLASNVQATAVGFQAVAGGYQATAVGAGSGAYHSNSMVFGAGVTSSAPNQITFGSPWQYAFFPGNGRVGGTLTNGTSLVTNLVVDQLPLLSRDTNQVFVLPAGSLGVDGTYLFASAGLYTNNPDSRFTINFQNPTWFISSNSVNFYSGPSPAGPWTISTAGAASAPAGGYGLVFNQAGVRFTGIPTSTGAVAQVIATVLSTVAPQALHSTNADNATLAVSAIASGIASNSYRFSILGATTNYVEYLTNIVSTVYSDNRNELYVTVAGTAAARGKYVFQKTAFGSLGAIFTNVSGTGFACSNLNGFSGSQDGSKEASPFYLGPTTNNDLTAWYYNPLAIIGVNWLIDNDNLDNSSTTGLLPFPITVWGTNSVTVTNTVLVRAGFVSTLADSGRIGVDIANGDDTGAGLGLCPFKTCAAAKAAASYGQTIEVWGNVNGEANLLKNGVNWLFHGTVGRDAQSWELDNPIFTDAAIGAITSNIEADQFHYVSESYKLNNGMMITNPASRVTLTVHEIDSAMFNEIANPAVNQATTICNVSNCSFVKIKADYAGNRLIGTTRSRVDRRTDSNTYGQLINHLSLNCGFQWWAGEEHIEIDHMKALVGERTQAAIWSRGLSLTDASDFYVNMTLLEGCVYTTGLSTNQKVWLTITEHITTNVSAFFPYGYEKVYDLRSSKIETRGIGIPFNLAGGGGQRMWITTQKVSSPAGWFYLGGGPHKIVMNVAEFEDTGSSGSPPGGTGNNVGIELDAPTAEFYLTTQTAKSKSTILRVTSSGIAKTEITGRFDTSSGTNPCFMVVSSNLTLAGCRIISGSTNAIQATNAQTVRCYYVVANKTNNLNVTLSPPNTNLFQVDATLQ